MMSAIKKLIENNQSGAVTDLSSTGPRVSGTMYSRAG